MSTCSYHVEASHISIEIHVLWSDLHVVSSENTMRSGQEPKKLGIWMKLLSHVKKAHNDIVATRSLSTTQDTSKLYEKIN